jgi:hypothetical protein
VPHRLLLPAGQPKQHQPGTDHIKRSRVEIIDRVVENVVSAHHQVGHIEPGQISHIDVDRHDLTARAHPPGQPGGHRPPAGTHLEAPPARPHQLAPLTGARIKHLLQELQPLILGGLPARRLQAVARIGLKRRIHRESINHAIAPLFPQGRETLIVRRPATFCASTDVLLPPTERLYRVQALPGHRADDSASQHRGVPAGMHRVVLRSGSG